MQFHRNLGLNSRMAAPFRIVLHAIAPFSANHTMSPRLGSRICPQKGSNALGTGLALIHLACGAKSVSGACPRRAAKRGLIFLPNSARVARFREFGAESCSLPLRNYSTVVQAGDICRHRPLEFVNLFLRESAECGNGVVRRAFSPAELHGLYGLTPQAR